MVPLSPDDIALHRRADRPHQRDDRRPGRAERRRVRRHLRGQHRPRRLQASAEPLVRGPRPDRAGLPAAPEREGRGQHGALGACPARRDPAAVPSGGAGGRHVEGRPAPSASRAARASGARAVGRVRLGRTRRGARDARPGRAPRGGRGSRGLVHEGRDRPGRGRVLEALVPRARRDHHHDGAREGLPAAVSPIAESLGPGLFRSSPRSNRLVYAAAGASCSSRSCGRACSGSRSGWAATSGWRSADGHSSFTPRAQVFHRRRRDLADTRDPWRERGASSSAWEWAPPPSSGSGRRSGMTCSAPPRSAASSPRARLRAARARPTSTASGSPRASGRA